MSAVAVATATPSSASSPAMSETRTATSNSNNISNPMEEEETNPDQQQEQQQQHLEHQEENASQPPQQQQQQQQQHPQPQHAESQPATETAAEIISETNNNHHRPVVADPPLPADLRMILVQVAKTGACSWLSWDSVSKDLPPEPANNISNNINTLNNGNANGTANANAAASAPTMSASGLSSILASRTTPLLASSTPNATLSNNNGTNNANNTTSSRQPPFSTHRRSTSSPYAPTSSQQQPPRKKHRNGLHKSSRRRFATTDGSNTQTATGSVVPRKRPLFLIRTTTAGTTTTNTTPVQTNTNTNPSSTLFSAGSIAGSVGSGRTSGSEPDGDSTQFDGDSTQYECDSEGTSATTNSEVSVERLRKSQQRIASAMLTKGERPSHLFLGQDGATASHTSYYKTLQEALRVALGLVLDHFYSKRGGYTLSPSEKRRNATLVLGGDKNNKGGTPPLSPDSVFQQRRQRLLTMLMPPRKKQQQREDRRQRQRVNDTNTGPPFTIQRIAEVLVSPERFYTQTHKLCNCLEKLLLVTSSPGAFGGSMGGDTSQSRLEERELAALADEKGRQESELRQRRLRRRTSSPSDDVMMDYEPRMHTKDDGSDNRRNLSPEKKSDHYDGNHHGGRGKNGGEATREMLEAAARASLRSKFDHVGLDSHSSEGRDVRAIAESRGMTNSPPPPSLSMSAALTGHAGAAGFVRQHHPDQNPDHPLIARVSSPILFTHGGEPTHASTSMHMLQLHHAATLAGNSMSGAGSLPFDLALHGRAQGNLGGSENPDLEVEHGRSSASNSDVDSESDDVSLDDSASDRSDGSDSGSVPHYEPFTAARAMALNRMQQQQRLQSRVLTSLTSLHQSEGFRPPADSEYQSGDSIDSMRAEDSGGSDSSSSDIAD